MTLTEPQRGRAAAWQNATITDIVVRTPHIKSFFFVLPQPFEFRAGQHVDVRLTAPDGYQAMRSYSIASAPGPTGVIELAIDLLNGGEVSPFFHEVAAVGDEIELRGPLGGHFVWGPEDGGPLLLIGGGSGVVPLMSMVRAGQAAATLAPVPTALLLSARSWDDALYRDELITYGEQGNEFSVAFALTREPAQRPQDYGRRVDAAILREVMAQLPGPPKHVFVCGSNAFVNAAADAVLAAGVAPAGVRTERYGG